MELYIKKGDELKKTTLIEVLYKAIKNQKLIAEMDKFNDGSGSWISVKQNTSKPSELNTVFGFNDSGDTLNEIEVYEADIKTFVDDENMRKLTK